MTHSPRFLDSQVLLFVWQKDKLLPEISYIVTIKLVSDNYNFISSSDKFLDYDTLISLNFMNL